MSPQLLTPAEQYLVLASGAKTSPSPRPRDRRAFRASYCSHRDDTGDVVFDPIYFGVLWAEGNRARIDRCLETKRAMGVDAIQLCVQGGYPGYWQGKTFDFRGNPQRYGDLCRYIRNAGFTPIILVSTADGGTSVEIYDGTMRNVLKAVKDLARDAWFCHGYEVNADRGGGFTAKQTDDAIALEREVLGPDALILLWLQPGRCTPATYYGSDPYHQPASSVPLKWIGSATSGAWIEADDPYEGDEQGAYYKAHGVDIDGLWYQTPHGLDGPSYADPSGAPGLDAWGQPRYLDRVIEIADRFLPPGTPMPGALGHKSDDGHGGYVLHTSSVAPSIHAPYWFHEPRARGPVLLCVGETVPYEYMRDACCDEAVSVCCETLESVGVTVHGCWRAYED